jgi:hypothetical protein
VLLFFNLLVLLFAQSVSRIQLRQPGASRRRERQDTESPWKKRAFSGPGYSTRETMR